MDDDFYIGTIMPFAYGFVPRNWLKCDGAIYSVGTNTALYSLIGNFYGGEYMKTFAVPDLRGKVLLNYGGAPGLTNWQIGQKMGSERVQVDADHMPKHSHECEVEHMDAKIKCYTGSDSMTDNPVGNSIAGITGVKQYSNVKPEKTLNWETIEFHESPKTGNAGGSESHYNMQPSLVMNYCICAVGIYPSRD